MMNGSSQETYTVERLLCDRINTKTKKQEFLTKWVGWPLHSDDTWEPIEHFKNCPEVVEEYWRMKRTKMERNQPLLKNKKIAACHKSNVTLKKNTVKKTDRVLGKLSDELEKQVVQISTDTTNQKRIGQRTRAIIRRAERPSEPSDVSGNSQEQVQSVRNRLGHMPSATTNLQDRVQIKNGFDRGLIVEKIIGATDITGELGLLIKWRDVDEQELIPTRIIRNIDPQLVIQFYESHRYWVDDAENKE